MKKIKTCLISVFYKTNLDKIVALLKEQNEGGLNDVGIVSMDRGGMLWNKVSHILSCI